MGSVGNQRRRIRPSPSPSRAGPWWSARSTTWHRPPTSNRGRSTCSPPPPPDGPTPRQVAVLKAPRGQSEEEFGRSVAISGNTIVVGAPFREVGNHTGQGEAYVFVKPASGWKSVAPTAELTARRGAAHEYFGESVAISGHTVLVGAPGRRVGSHTAQGAVDVFAVPARHGPAARGSWPSSPHPTGRPTTPWASPSPSPAGRSSPGPISTGSARPRTRGLSTSSRSAPTGWRGARETAELSNERGESGELFGRIVAISQNTVVVGAPDRRGENPEQGAAYVFVKPSHGWAGSLTQTAELTASDPGRSDQFGGALAISGGLIVAGAAGHTLGENTEQGAGYVFVEPATGWVTATETQRADCSEWRRRRQARPVRRDIGRHAARRCTRPSGAWRTRAGRRLRLPQRPVTGARVAGEGALRAKLRATYLTP